MKISLDPHDPLAEAIREASAKPDTTYGITLTLTSRTADGLTTTKLLTAELLSWEQRAATCQHERDTFDAEFLVATREVSA